MGSITVGGRKIGDSNLSTSKVLVAYINNSTNPAYSTFQTEAGSGYTPSSTNKFICTGIRIINNDTTSLSIVIGYGDNDAGNNNSTEPTNAVYGYSGDNTILCRPPNTVGDDIELPLDFEVPNGKYPFIKEYNGGSTNCVIFLTGYETV